MKIMKVLRFTIITLLAILVGHLLGLGFVRTLEAGQKRKRSTPVVIRPFNNIAHCNLLINQCVVQMGNKDSAGGRLAWGATNYNCIQTQGGTQCPNFSFSISVYWWNSNTDQWVYLHNPYGFDQCFNATPNCGDQNVWLETSPTYIQAGELWKFVIRVCPGQCGEICDSPLCSSTIYWQS